MEINNRFNEKATEYSVKQGKEIAVWQSPKYLESKRKAIEMIDSGKYGLANGDFWILMNETKSGKMAYTGLIISHNGCLKINDHLDDKLKFKPQCVFENASGYRNSLVYTYNCEEQGIYEVGEVSDKNCKNDYPYAMALKRCFDRVVLKNSKLAYAGVYSEAEADEFEEKITETPTDKKESTTQIEQTPTVKKATPKQVEILAKNYTGDNLTKLLTVNGIEKLEDIPLSKASELIKKLYAKGDRQ